MVGLIHNQFLIYDLIIHHILLIIVVHYKYHKNIFVLIYFLLLQMIVVSKPSITDISDNGINNLQHNI